MKVVKLVNVTCSNEACTKPLLAFRIGKKQTGIQSYGTAMRTSPPRLGVDRRAWAICPNCGTETEFDAKLLPMP